MRLLLGPIALDGTETADHCAEVIVDPTRLGRPASQMGDIDGDGRPDLVLIKADASGPSGSTATVRIVFGGQSLPRLLDPTALATLRTKTVVVTSSVKSVAYDATVLNWNGDGKRDLFIAAPDKGYLFSGATIMDPAKPSLAVSDRLFEVTHDDPASFAVRGIVAGDVNGDGLDDLLFQDKAPGAGSRVYVLAGRPDNRLPASSLALGTYAEAILTFGDRTVGSEEHTSELQSQSNIVCRLLLEKKKQSQSNLVCRLLLEKKNRNNSVSV